MNTHPELYRGKPITEPLDPALFYVIGRDYNMTAAAARMLNPVLGYGFGELTLALLLNNSPDGVIIQHGTECYITRDRHLAPFDPNAQNWTNEPARGRPCEMTPREWRAYLSSGAR